jgi:subtilisin family serine protease
VSRLYRFCVAIMLLFGGGSVHAGAPSPEDNAHKILVMLQMAPDHFRAGTSYGGAYGDLASRAGRMRIARAIAQAHKLRIADDWPMPLLAIDCIVMLIPDARTPDQVATELASEKAIAWSQPLALYHGEGGSADPLRPAQPAEKMWRLGDLHRIATGRGVSIAVIDSRIDNAHPDLKGQIAVSQDFVPGRGQTPERHGTNVAGIISARSDNGIGISGIAPAARLMGLRACWDTGGPAAGPATLCDSLSLAKALHFAIERRAEIINLSLTGPRDLLLARLIAIGLTRGATIVAAIDPAQHDGGFPASQTGVIAVSTDPVVSPAGAVYGAPGRDIPTTGPGGTWLLVNGNSFAAAHVSGLMALAREHAPRSNPPLVRSAAGLVDACRTVSCPLPLHDRACPESCTAAR